MALGKIKADTLEHSTAGSLDTQYVVNGSAKAWINFNGTGTIATRESLNISSITDVTTGTYNVTKTNSFSNANYITNVSTGGGSFVTPCVGHQNGSFTIYTASVTQTENRNQNAGDLFDATLMLLSYTGDLA
jgi:hypothetical protein